VLERHENLTTRAAAGSWTRGPPSGGPGGRASGLRDGGSVAGQVDQEPAVNPQAILAAVPWLRRIWKLTPPQLRVPLLLLVAIVGIVQFVQGRKAQLPAHVDGATDDPRSARGARSLASGG
jgi:hypothetical protein